jgi:hypothetical protein
MDMERKRMETSENRTVKDSFEEFDYERVMMLNGYIARFRDIRPLPGMERHHLVPKAILKNGPHSVRALVDWIPTVPLTTIEHQRTVHQESFNAFLRSYGFDLRRLDYLSHEDIDRALEAVGRYYSMSGLEHFAKAVGQFRSYYRNRTANR